MLLGEHRHTLDTKKRLSLPSKFRKELGKTVVITRGLDSSLSVYSLKEFKKFAEKLSDLSMGQSDSRNFKRLILGSAVETPIDSAGRILIPEYLKNLAGLKQKVVVVGLLNRVELWDEERWLAYQNNITSKTEVLAEKLGDMGMI